MSSSDPQAVAEPGPPGPPGELGEPGDLGQWAEISGWLERQPAGPELLTVLSLGAPPPRQAVEQLTALSGRSGAPPALTAVVTGGHLADAWRESGHPDRAAELFAHALAIGTARGDQGNRAWVLAQSAIAFEDLGRPADADAALGEALRIMRANDDQVGQEWVFGRLTAVLLDRRDWNGAARAYREAAASAEVRGDAFAVSRWEAMADGAQAQDRA